MKTIKTLLILFLFSIPCLLSCNDKEKKASDPNVEESAASNKEKQSSNTIELKQHGDYSSLLNAGRRNCSYITANDIAAALDIDIGAIEDTSSSGFCNFKITLPDQSLWTLSTTWFSMSKEHILQEIKSFYNEDNPLNAQVSATGDTHLCIHPFNNWLILYNPNYEGAVQLNYCSVIECRDLDSNQKEQRKEMAISLANYLLKKHQK